MDVTPTAGPPPAAEALPWRTLFAAQLGWMLDGMDVMLYAFALTQIREEFGLGGAGAGAVASVTLLTSAFGGLLFGVLADRYGRARALAWSILVYSAFTGLTATATSVAALVFWRALVGIGLGGEWSAGSVLVAETWPARHRGKAIGFVQAGWAIGYILAALLAALVLPRWGWRPLFVLGVAPALLAWWVRRHIPEPELWRATRAAAAKRPGSGLATVLAVVRQPPYGRRVVLATTLTTLLLFAYWGLFTWIPTYLASPVEAGGAGMGLVRSTGWIVPMQLGAFAGYVLFGVLADRLGRRPVFLVFVLAAAVLVPIYALVGARSPLALMLLGPLVGAFGHGYFSVFGALLAELFPSTARGTLQGFCYNAGRALSAFAPAAIGALADRSGLGSALAVTSVFFVAGALVMLRLPETRGEALT